ncbi:MAG: hypothetical protein GX838_01195 [Clostridiaceae bacterium]|nr:hypothetical protein [Clostridiaceae bacterium]
MDTYVVGSRLPSWEEGWEDLREEREAGKPILEEPGIPPGKLVLSGQSVPRLAEVLGISIEHQMK